MTSTTHRTCSAIQAEYEQSLKLIFRPADLFEYRKTGRTKCISGSSTLLARRDSPVVPYGLNSINTLRERFEAPI
jgi:hypothetical protein